MAWKDTQHPLKGEADMRGDKTTSAGKNPATAAQPEFRKGREPCNAKFAARKRR